MKSEWITQRLSEIVDFNPRESLPKGGRAKKIPMDALQPYCRDIPTYEVTEFNGGTKFRNGDTLMARITPCLENGKTAQVNILGNDEIGFGSTEFIVFRAKKGISDPDYIYYLVSSPLVRDPSIKSMVGSSGRQRVQTDVVQGLQVPVPPLEEQRKIAGILRTLDDKIKLNTEINKNLEEQAKTVFEKEFLARDHVPAGWTRGSLVDIADYLNGLAMQKYRPAAGEQGLPVLKIKELRQGSCDSNSELCSSSIKKDYIIHDGDVIFSWSGSLLVDFWCGGTCGLNQHLFKITSKKYDKWFYYAWTNSYLQKFAAIAADMATTMGHIKREELAKAEVLIPNNCDYERIGNLLSPIYALIISNRIENRRLASLRDGLLPQLMAGTLDVTDIEL